MSRAGAHGLGRASLSVGPRLCFGPGLPGQVFGPRSQALRPKRCHISAQSEAWSLAEMRWNRKVRNLLLSSVVVGAGITIGMIGMKEIGGFAYEAANTYVQIQQAKDPIYINAQNETKFTELLNRITKNRHDDFEHYCRGPMDAAMDSLADSAKKSLISMDQYQKELNSITLEWGGKCAARYGWDNFNAPNITQEYNRVIRPKMEAGWFGDHEWLEKKMDEYFK
jgi:hypothetical protein